MMTRSCHRKVRRCPLITVLVLLAMIAGCSSEPEYVAHDIQGVMPDLAFDLTNEQGERVDAKDYPGRLRLMFFGFTNCPDICPATMARIKAALQNLDAEQRQDIEVLFVSVDPKRDTPKQLKRFTSLFDPRFVGLTGTQKQLETLSKRYRITYSYGEPDDNGFYLVSHSSAIFVFDSQGRARLLANQDESIDELTADLEKLLNATTG